MDTIQDVVLNCVQPIADKAAVLNKRDDSTSSRDISNVSFVNLEVDIHESPRPGSPTEFLNSSSSIIGDHNQNGKCLMRFLFRLVHMFKKI